MVNGASAVPTFSLTPNFIPIVDGRELTEQSTPDRRRHYYTLSREIDVVVGITTVHFKKSAEAGEKPAPLAIALDIDGLTELVKGTKKNLEIDTEVDLPVKVSIPIDNVMTSELKVGRNRELQIEVNHPSADTLSISIRPAKNAVIELTKDGKAIELKLPDGRQTTNVSEALISAPNENRERVAASMQNVIQLAVCLSKANGSSAQCTAPVPDVRRPGTPEITR